MQALLIADSDYATGSYERLRQTVQDFLEARGYQTECLTLAWNDLAPCRGCFGCWMQKPGECVINDGIARINRLSMAGDAVIYLSPIVYGQFSPTLKTVIDRWLPNMLPFFTHRRDGSTIHPPRYPDYPPHVAIGYADGLNEEDARLFADITLRHRSNVPVLIWRDSPAELTGGLAALNWARKGGSL